MRQSDSQALTCLSEHKSSYLLHVGYRVAVWAHNKWIVVLLAMMMIGHWFLILQGIQSCVNLANRTPLQVFSWLSSGFPVLIVKSRISIPPSLQLFLFIRCVSTLWSSMQMGKKGARTKLVGMVFSDGLIYFFIAHVCFIFQLSDTETFLFKGLWLLDRQAYGAQPEYHHEYHFQCPSWYCFNSEPSLCCSHLLARMLHADHGIRVVGRLRNFQLSGPELL